ncbi:hypothetical protein MKW94_003088, partial [Papaver nudicaule]|nr:hypothetical protein [Papaver nudicaule]
VYNGMTQLGFEKFHREFSFGTEQRHVSLYMTAISSLSRMVGKPIIKVNPDEGLEVKLSGSAADGSPPTTLSPTMLVMDWRCEKSHNTPYEVNITIPVEGYEPIDFILTKMCESRQDSPGDATRGWALFGVLSCIFIVTSTVFCCGAFIYRTRVEHLVSGGGGLTGGYTRAEDPTNTFSNQVSWERQPVSGQGTRRTTEVKYGSI